MSARISNFVEIEVIKRNGQRVSFNPEKIEQAIEKAFMAEYEELTAYLKDVAGSIVSNVLQRAAEMGSLQGELDIEKIQDIVEQEIMASNQYNVARRYILYREERKRARILSQGASQTLHIIHKDGSRQAIDIPKIRQRLLFANQGLEARCSPSAVLEEALRHLYDGATHEELHQSLILSARVKIEKDPSYNYFTARLLLQKIYEECFQVDIFDGHTQPGQLQKLMCSQFKEYITLGIRCGRLDAALHNFDLDKLSKKIDASRDFKFKYLGLQILYDRYLIHDQNRRIETPQYFWMRVAMGLALHEKDKEARALEFYDVLSQFDFVSGTPTLFNSGTCHPQLSSCYLSTIYDDLDHIFKVIADNARLSKWAGGIGNDWTYVRARGAMIKGTNGLTQGIIPFLKVANDTAVAVNQGGKRKGATCAYLETWHLDIEDFLELRKNTGDDRRRTHDMNTANWIPDLFMQRVQENRHWTLFNPSETSDLHDLYGLAFKTRYEEYEKLAAEGKLKQHKTLPAIELWRKMLTMLFETGHPWITFKDPCNIRSPQKHVGVVHSSNLCTEITLNTSDKETAVCNLGSLNLVEHMIQEGNQWVLDVEKISRTIKTAIRMLDNVIEINYYPTPESRDSNLRHRPIGLGIMGFQDALYLQKISYDSQEAVEFADLSMELIAYHAILASAHLAKERGRYSSYQGSLWDQGLLPLDTLDLLFKERSGGVSVDRTSRLDWSQVREAVQSYGMRNSNTMAIAPTATIAHIAGVSPSIEPTYANLFARSNLSGEFISLNPYLVEELIARKLWNDDLLDELKYYDGSLQEIEGVPDDLKGLYKSAFEIDPRWLVECAGRRQKWIDQGQSLNLYVASPVGKTLNDLYMLAWQKGLKTTYYLRSLGATQVEKSTIDINKKGIQPRWMKSKSASANIKVDREPKACSLDNPECESCQ